MFPPHPTPSLNIFVIFVRWKKVKVNILNNIILCRHSLSSEPLCQLFIDRWTLNICYWRPGLPRFPGVPKPSILVVLGVLGVLESWSPVTVHGPGLPRLPGLPKPSILRVLGVLGVLESWSPVTVHGPGLPRLPRLPISQILMILAIPESRLPRLPKPPIWRALGVSGVLTTGLPISSKFGILGVLGVLDHEL